MLFLCENFFSFHSRNVGHLTCNHLWKCLREKMNYFECMIGRLFIFCLVYVSWLPHVNAQSSDLEVDIDLFYDLLKAQPVDREAALEEIESSWHPSYTAPLAEMLILVDQADVFKNNVYEWWEWIWSQNATYTEFYPDLKSRIYQNIDPKFNRYFAGRFDLASIRFDEILWGGVRQDGIPHPYAILK